MKPKQVKGSPEVKVNMSRLTRMMAANSGDLSKIHTVRQDKIEAYKRNLDEDLVISDEQIDTILRKMIVA